MSKPQPLATSQLRADSPSKCSRTSTAPPPFASPLSIQDQTLQRRAYRHRTSPPLAWWICDAHNGVLIASAPTRRFRQQSCERLDSGAPLCRVRGTMLCSVLQLRDCLQKGESECRVRFLIYTTKVRKATSIYHLPPKTRTNPEKDDIPSLWIEPTPQKGKPAAASESPEDPGLETSSWFWGWGQTSQPLDRCWVCWGSVFWLEYHDWEEGRKCLAYRSCRRGVGCAGAAAMCHPHSQSGLSRYYLLEVLEASLCLFAGDVASISSATTISVSPIRDIPKAITPFRSVLSLGGGLSS